MFITIEWLGRKREFAIEIVKIKLRPFRYSFYYSLVILIYWFASENVDQQFIYFQF